jgi:uncharacterized protein (TIGR03000 family)
VAAPDLALRPVDPVAYLRVHVPAEAEVWLEGKKCQQTGPVREFVSPPLAPDSRYAYEVRARWTEPDGTPVEQTQTVEVQAGRYARVAFPLPPESERLPPPKPLPREQEGP